MADVGQRAVVLGASMAGLMAARVLAEFYGEVVVVDRDDLSEVSGTPRNSVRQGGHAHALLARGLRVLEELYPGLTDELVALGMPVGDLGDNLRWIFNGRQIAKVHTGLVVVSLVRPLLEGHVRTRTAALGVVFRDRTDILGLATTADRGRVTGVRVRDQADDSTEVLEADLVLDATGRGSRTPAWLEELGYERAPEEKIKVGLSYVTQHFRLPEDLLGDDLASIPVATPGHPRGAVFSRACGRWQLSLTGILGDQPPTDQEGFLAYAKSLPVPEIHEWVRDAERIDTPTAIRYPASVRRHYEKLTRFPAGMLVLGDGATSFNPVYAQGMTVAALEVLKLRENLRRGSVPHFRRWFADIAKVIDAPWEIATTGDLAFPGVEGRRTAKVRFVNAYLARLHAGAPRDPHLSNAFLRVAGLIDAPPSMMKPGTLLRVLRAGKPPATTATTGDRLRSAARAD
ncbi:2-polyprenyl-6-methoxyphenol hydroxylase-like FAD-dependent oxidoreductase [Saccharothrix variisporea]|uniref:2-polyprenyl-6-methoxyphenol hydroxylase-like FAD-dependent oxidoreductase n=2 Tax=Saccharothrix variisporea TaxID=543527 RepID=A0A495X127_9PSEU|nr:FAD-dependent monooxygenase [Saccharothrix variisporea]RKT66975.1 2-polyprenyl-6-methoxyphenol hydroxylase-like FAD-dependent oxidoreductase [Saccharothrix variisporea]